MPSDSATRAPATEGDVRLVPFLRAGDEAAEREALAMLMAVHAQPLIGKILHGKLGRSSPGAEMEDLGSKVVVLLLARLHLQKEGAGDEAVHDFGKYVATTTYRVCHDYLREKHPERHRLKTRLRYLLTREPRFALWEGAEGVWLCGWAAWRGAGLTASASARPRLAGTDSTIGLRSWERHDLIEALASVFDGAGHPISFDGLVGLLAERSRSMRASGAGALEVGGRPAPGDPVRQADDHIFLKQLWIEIGKLPLRMRTVLLLNLRGHEGRDVIGLLPATGIASVRDMAHALEMPVEQLAALWPDLPLDDRALAARLNATRQQVINLRASARRRLALRMGYDE
jgi:hypothetical protein